MNTVILKAQQMSLEQFRRIRKPHGGRPYKKAFFQCELQEYSNGDAVFGLIAYGGYKKNGKRCGPREVLQDIPGETVVTSWPLAFGNMEFAIHPLKKTKGKVLTAILEKLKGDKKMWKDTFVTLTPCVSKNPHVEYTISLDGNAEMLNPSPPTPPSDF